eukprot:359833-Chlamydomonas_euryale.AAC.22
MAHGACALPHGAVCIAHDASLLWLCMRSGQSEGGAFEDCKMTMARQKFCLSCPFPPLLHSCTLPKTGKLVLVGA